jgi:tetratricopeptide (TPR) repeat protein
VKRLIQTGSVFCAVAAALIFWGLAFSLACRLAAAGPSAESAPSGVLDRMAGSLRAALAGSLFNRADVYFHAGRDHAREKAFHGFYDRVRDGLMPQVHRHAEREEASEILPWLRWSTATDPANVEAYLAAAYWMEREVRQSDRVDPIFREAARHNPRDYRIGLDWGRSRARRGDIPGAVRLLGSALRRWPAPLKPEEDTARYDLVSLLEIRGLLLLHEGRRVEALRHLRRAQTLRPGSRGLNQWIAGIEAGDPMTGELEKLKDTLLAAPGPLHCDEHDHDHDGDHDSDEDREPGDDPGPARDRGLEFPRGVEPSEG